ncbi:MAG: CHAT domain-containing protein, partial [Holophagales bacterium]|nr:CHAT domain-containing protein [Holophagales bacterium]
RRRHTEPSENDSFVAFASGTGLSLPARDIRSVARFFPSSRQTFGPAEAEFELYEQHAAKADHLLIATHGVHTQASRRGTYLQIRPTADLHDERLTAAEIAAIPLNAELVTLAACDTDRGDALLSDERLTLTRSFLVAGASSVLATRWRIPEDRGTTRFLVDFYQAYRAGGPDGTGMRKDRALTSARRKAVERGEPAQIWAPWVLVGDAR